MKKRIRKQDQEAREYLFSIYNTLLTESPKIVNAIPKQSKPAKKIYNKRSAIHPVRRYNLSQR